MKEIPVTDYKIKKAVRNARFIEPPMAQLTEERSPRQQIQTLIDVAQESLFNGLLIGLLVSYFMGLIRF